MKWVVFVGCGLVAAAAGAARDGEVRRVSLTDPDENRRSDELAAEFRATARRSRVKTDVAAALVRGEVSVGEAEAAFRKLLTAEPLVRARLREEWPAASDRELVLRNLAAFVEWRHRHDPERVAVALGKLNEAIAHESSATSPSAVLVPVR